MKKFFVCLFSLLFFVGVAGTVYAIPSGPPYMGIIDENGYSGSDITFAGKAYTDISSGWYTAGDAIWTANSGSWVEYTANLDLGNWNIGLNVINHGNLGSDSGWYPQFEVFNTLTNDTIFIPASDTEVNYGFINLDIFTAGDYSVKYTWLNDKYGPGYVPQLDANIQINSAFFDNTETVPIIPSPEPATMLLLGTGLIGIAGFGRKKIKN